MRNEIRKGMVHNFRTGGKRAKYLWFRRWFGMADGQLSFLRTGVMALTGFYGLGTMDFTVMIVFLLGYVPFAIIFGFLYHWFDFVSMDNYISNIMNPFCHDVKKSMGIKWQK